MTSKTIHQQTKARLLIDNLLNLRGEASPLNLVYDSPEQSARLLLREFIQRAQSTGTSVIFVSFENIRPPNGVDHFIKARAIMPHALQSQLLQLCADEPRSLIVFDSLAPFLLATRSYHSFFTDIAGPKISLVLVYHANAEPVGFSNDLYVPHTIRLLEFLAVSIFTVKSIAQAKARQESIQAGKVYLEDGIEASDDGVLVGKGANVSGEIVVEVEHRRRSGRSVGISLVLHFSGDGSQDAVIELRDNHAVFSNNQEDSQMADEEPGVGTFNLHLTPSQKKARAGITLPYFDAQQGYGEGGKILYDMGEEDDFDEEEDEI